MFKVELRGVNYKVKFQHSFKSKMVVDSTGKLVKQCYPCRTACAIIVNDKVVAEGVAAPVREYAVMVSDARTAMAQYRRRLKKVYPVEVDDNGNTKFVAILKGDHFNYSDGRKKALEKALNVFTKDDRVVFWHALLKMENKVE